MLISPICVHHPEWLERTLPVSITQEQVRNSPDIDTDKPVSRQNEVQYLGYYGFPAYLGGQGICYRICYLVIDTSNWWAGHRVPVAPRWIKGVHWSEQAVSVDLSRDAIRKAPSYDSTMRWGPEQDSDLYRHYGRTGYWADRSVLEPSI